MKLIRLFALAFAVVSYAFTSGCDNGGDTKEKFEDVSSPQVIAAVFTDADSSRTVNAGDQVAVIFNKAVSTNSTTINDFHLAVTGDTLASATVAQVSDSTTITITLGLGDKLTVNGTYDMTRISAGSPSGIDVAANNSITDAGGRTAVQSIFRGVDVRGHLEPFGPGIASAFYEDANHSGTVSSGDTLRVTFESAVSTLGGNAADCFTLAVSGDGFGTDATFGPVTASTTVLITLGAGVVLTPDGTFSSGNSSAGAPSGIAISSSIPKYAIYSSENGGTIEPNGTFDVGGSTVDPIPPELVSADYNDMNGNGGIDAGDRILLEFTEDVKLDSGAPGPVTLSNEDFLLPVSGDWLGAGATVSDGTAGDNQMYITLGTSPVLNVLGAYSASDNTAGASTGIAIGDNMTADLITDFSSLLNNAVPSAVLDVEEGSFSPDLTAPRLVLVKWDDADCDSTVDAGEEVTLKFSETVRLDGGATGSLAVGAGYFALPVTGDTLGTSPTIRDDVTGDRKLVITLGASPSFTAAGLYSLSANGSGSASGIGIGASMPANFIEDASFYNNDAASGEIKDISETYKSVDQMFNASDMTDSRYKHTQTTLSNGSVLVTGGLYEQATPIVYTSCEIYHPGASPGCGSWTFCDSLSDERIDHAAVLLPNGRVLVTGGRSQRDGFAHSVYKTAEVYNPSTDTWSSASDMPAGRYGHDAFLLPDNRVIILNGYEGSYYNNDSDHDLVWEMTPFYYDYQTDTWDNGSNDAVTCRYSHSAVCTADGRVISLGGFGEDQLFGVLNDTLNSFEIYSGGEYFHQDATLSRDKTETVAVCLENGTVITLGGYSEDLHNSTSDIELFYAASTVGTSVVASAELMTPRRRHNAALLPNEKVFIFSGGYMMSSALLIQTRKCEIYDPHTDTICQTADLMAYSRQFPEWSFLPGDDGVVGTDDDWVFMTGGLSSSGTSLEKCEIYKY